MIFATSSKAFSSNPRVVAAGVPKIISLALKNSKDEEKLQQAKERVAKLTAEYPLYLYYFSMLN
jgi:hypothetical protein